jgi:glycerol-3-phosphate O-acyltransferase
MHINSVQYYHGIHEVVKGHRAERQPSRKGAFAGIHTLHQQHAHTVHAQTNSWTNLPIAMLSIGVKHNIRALAPVLATDAFTAALLLASQRAADTAKQLAAGPTFAHKHITHQPQ